MTKKISSFKSLVLEDHLCYQLYTTSLKMTQLYKPMLAELNITYPQYLVMLVLWQKDGIGVKELAHRLKQDSGSITPLVKRLAAEGYISRGRDPEDERNVVLKLSKRGLDLQADAERVHAAISDICGLVQKDQKSIVSNIRSLNSRISEKLS